MVMRLVAESTGVAYFPGLAQPVTIDTSELSEQEAEDLQRLVDEAGFFDLPSITRMATRRLPDMWLYCLTVEEGSRCHTVHLTDPAGDPTLQTLLDVVRHEAEATRQASRPAD